MKQLLLMGAVLPLAACVTPVSGAADVQQAAEGALCRDEGLARFAGQLATAQLGGEILRASGASTLQWVAHGSMVTMDYRAERVRVWLDAQNRVARVNCG